MPNRAIKISWEVQESLKMVDHGGLSERQFATPRVACITFIVRHETCLTHDNLQKRGFTVCSRYLLCEEAVEFLHCAFTRHIWTMFPTIFGVHWVMPGCIKLLQCSWYTIAYIKWYQALLDCYPCLAACFFCSLGWKGHGYFEDKEDSTQQVKSRCLKNMNLWYRKAPVSDFLSILDLLCSFNI